MFVINEDKSIDFKYKHPQNIYSAFQTLFVLNENKSIDSKNLLLKNIWFIFITFFEFNEDKSFDIKDEQLQDINAVDVNNFLNLNLIFINPISSLFYK